MLQLSNGVRRPDVTFTTQSKGVIAANIKMIAVNFPVCLLTAIAQKTPRSA